ncbi:MAG: metal-dependent hydrolase [Verrucomicrobiota bacterium]|jgi:L-ascorbate metabolism protein UlaG (beta-lactamase superfamily)
MNVTYYGHACFAVEVGVDTLLFDPFITPNPQAAGIDLKSVRADYILVSHGHQDHLADAVELAKRTGAPVLANYEVATWLGKMGAPAVHPMNHGGAVGFEFGRVKLVNAIHSSSMPDGSYGGNPGGFVVESAHGNFYYSGDTALTMDMKLIGESTRLAFAALCVGGNFTMDAEDAVKAAGFVQCDNILGVHFDTFPPIQINHGEAFAKFQAAGKKLHLLQIGESHKFSLRS